MIINTNDGIGIENIHKGTKNYLDNSNFRNPINQRGKAQYEGQGYTIDRWFTTSLNCLVTVNDGFISMSNYTASSETTNQTLKQKIETKGIAGKRMTLAAKLRGTEVALYIDTIAATSYAEYSDWTTLCLPFTVPEDADIIEIDIIGRAGSTWDCEWIALYEGEFTPQTAPPYIPKGYAEELMECYRYFWRCNNYLCIPGYKSTTAYAFVYLPVPMRAQPTPVLDDWTASKSYIYLSGSRANNITIGGCFMIDNSVRLTLIETSAIPNYNEFMFLPSNKGFGLSADL